MYLTSIAVTLLSIDNLKCPFTSVTVVVVSLLCFALPVVMVTPGNGSPKSSFTIPMISLLSFCADAGSVAKQSRKSNNNKCSFFIVNLINIDDLYLNPYVIKTYDH